MKKSLDSMQVQLTYRDNYIQNIKRILSGDIEDGIPENQPIEDAEDQDLERMAYVDSSFKAEFETGGDFLLMELDDKVLNG